MEQQDEPLVNFDVGPQSEEYEFLVDTGADRSSLRKLPTGVTIGTKTCEVLGAEGRPFRALIIEGVEIKGNSKYCVADFLYLPHTETNLLGRDLQVQLGVGVIPKDGKMVVHIMKLTQGDIQEINPEVWATEGKYGCLDIPPIKIEMQKDTPAIRVKQYPMSPEGKKGLASVIEHLLKENILEPCMSPHNTPILAIKKDEGKFRLVQDLREINKRTIARHPVVPNPYTLLSKIPREHTWFTVIDLKDAFWACPLAEECRDRFAFEWEHPDRGRKQQLRWTRLPQGYTESPNIFGQALETLLEQFSPTEGVQILQYVDDLLISGETEKEVKNVSIQLLNFFGEKGLKVSQSKLQFVETEVTYLGHIIGKGSKRLSPARISGIVSISPPKTKRDVRKLLGLFGYCKHWIDKYTQGVKFLYDKLIDQEPMNWTESDEKQLQDLKEKLSSAPVLSLPDLKKEFDLFVNTEKGIAYGVLTQEWGGYRKPVAFLSKLLDPVARGWPACLQAVAAAAILIEEAQKLTLQGKIKIHAPHDLKTILSQRAQKWLTDSRILKYEIVLINTDNLELTTSKSLNPAQFLSGEPTEEIEHHCLELIDMQTKVREDLEDTPLPYGRVLFTDGSSRVVEGKRTSGYSVIEGEKMEVLEKGKLPSNWSAQCCEIYALKRGLDLLKDDRGTIYTDSRYAFGIVHTFGSKDYLEGEEVTRKYLKTIGQTLENLRKKGYLPQTSPLDANVHNINPGDWPFETREDYWEAPNHLFWICGDTAYTKLPGDWSGSCTIGIIKPAFFLLPKRLGAHLGVPVYDNLGKVERKKRDTLTIGGDQKWKGKIWTPEEIIKTYGPATWAQDGSWGYRTPIYMLNRIIKLQAVLEMVSNRTALALDHISDQLTQIRAVIYQIRLAVDYLLADEGGICGKFNSSECCLEINDKSAVIKNISKEIRKLAYVGNQEWTPLMDTNWWNSFWSFKGDWWKKAGFMIICSITGLMFLPCLIPYLIRTITSTVQASIQIPKATSQKQTKMMVIESQGPEHENAKEIYEKFQKCRKIYFQEEEGIPYNISNGDTPISDLGCVRILAMLMVCQSNRDRNRVYQGRRLIGGAPPRQNQKSYLAGGSESRHQIVIDYEHEEKFQ
ncbi:hypothetical protein DUI87_17755 [Hirundo rustica rustica]|uniref:ribonuclease H n=1 Tax=Hirundo rustica rustica TaxID=333673 RepID=A0A3M0K357_HIRRU|nr:hypothetical protein DUI87_17755 [Hirundo rustica rustica]